MDNIEQHVQHLFQQARTQPVKTTSDEVFGAFVSTIAKGVTGIGTLTFNLKNLIIMFSTLGLLTSLVIWINPGSANSPGQPAAEGPQPVFNTTLVDHRSPETAESTLVSVASTTQEYNELPSEPKAELPVEDVSLTTVEPPKAPIPTAAVEPPVAPVFPEAPTAPIAEQVPSEPDTTSTEEEAEPNEAVNLTTVSYVISQNSTFEELEKMAKDAHEAGVMMRYDLKMKNDRIKKMELWYRIAGSGNNSCRNRVYIQAKGAFIRNIGWEEDSQGKVTRILN